MHHPMHLITHDNYEDATDAVRDILLMYWEMAYGSEGFSHAVDVHVRFDPLKFIDAETDGEAFYVDLDLLRSGSAIAILCAFYDLWSEEQSIANHPRTQRYEDSLKGGRLGAFPDIERVIREAIVHNDMSLEDEWFDSAVAPIYRKYVIGLFKQLAASDRSMRKLRFPFLRKLRGS